MYTETPNEINYNSGNENLYRKCEQVSVKSANGLLVAYIRPGLQQIGYIKEFYLNGFKDHVLTKTEQENLKDDQILDRCLKAVTELSKNTSEMQQMAILGLAMTKPSAIVAIQKCLSECFPLMNICELKDDVFLELIQIVQSDLNKTPEN
jgi:hypothetical protein